MHPQSTTSPGRDDLAMAKRDLRIEYTPNVCIYPTAGGSSPTARYFGSLICDALLAVSTACLLPATSSVARSARGETTPFALER